MGNDLMDWSMRSARDFRDQHRSACNASADLIAGLAPSSSLLLPRKEISDKELCRRILDYDISYTDSKGKTVTIHGSDIHPIYYPSRRRH